MNKLSLGEVAKLQNDWHHKSIGEQNDLWGRVCEQLINALQQNERLREVLQRIENMDSNTSKPFINQLASAVAMQALSNKESDDNSSEKIKIKSQREWTRENGDKCWEKKYSNGLTTWGVSSTIWNCVHPSDNLLKGLSSQNLEKICVTCGKSMVGHCAATGTGNHYDHWSKTPE